MINNVTWVDRQTFERLCRLMEGRQLGWWFCLL